jgi:hypothetical protein
MAARDYSKFLCVSILTLKSLPSRNRPNHQKRLLAGSDRLGERLVGRVVGEVLFTGKKAQERAALLGVMIADGAAQHGITGLERIQHRALRSSLVLQEANLGDVRRQMARTTQS